MLWGYISVDEYISAGNDCLSALLHILPEQTRLWDRECGNTVGSLELPWWTCEELQEYKMLYGFVKTTEEVCQTHKPNVLAFEDSLHLSINYTFVTYTEVI